MTNNKLYEFVMPLIQDENTHINSAVTSLNEFQQYQFENDKFGYTLTLYSESNNGFYFKFEYTSDEKSVSFPPFRTEDINLIHLIIDYVMSYWEGKENTDIPNANKYVELFKKALKNEKLPEQYTVTFENKGIQLHSSEWNYPIEVKDIDLRFFYSSIPHMEEPMSFSHLSLSCEAWNNHVAYLYIAKTQLDEYPLLQLECKSPEHYNKNPTVESWLTDIRDNTELPSTKVRSLIDFILIRDELMNTDEETEEKNINRRTLKI